MNTQTPNRDILSSGNITTFRSKTVLVSAIPEKRQFNQTFFFISCADESQSTSPDDSGVHEASGGGTEASPRINRFLARLPPDGCEKVCHLRIIDHLIINFFKKKKIILEFEQVCLKSGDTDHLSPGSAIFKSPAAFKLRPSLGSAFQPLQPILATPIASIAAAAAATSNDNVVDATATTPN